MGNTSPTSSSADNGPALNFAPPNNNNLNNNNPTTTTTNTKKPTQPTNNSGMGGGNGGSTTLAPSIGKEQPGIIQQPTNTNNNNNNKLVPIDKSSGGANGKVRVGYGVGAWMRSTALLPGRRKSRVLASHFLLLSRLPTIKEGKLTRLGTWSSGWLRDVEVYFVVKSCLILVYHGEEKSGGKRGSKQRRKSLGSIPQSQDFIIPDRVLVLAGGSCTRLQERENFSVTCQDGSSLQLKAETGRDRDSWVAALDRAIRQGNTRLSDFETYAKLARGHFGTVQLVKHIRTNTALALKQIEMRPKKPEKQFHERHILELLQSGATGASPFIARLCFAFRHDNCLYLATELASGGDLWALLRKVGKLQEATARFITAEVILGVRHVHSHGVLHRDIKLENLLLDGSGHIKMVDFGLSKRLFDPKSGIWDGRTYTVCGTNYYMSPEMLKKESSGHGLSTDWWQVGCLLYELIVGTPAFFEKGAKAIHKKILDMGGAPPFPRGVEPSSSCIDTVTRFLVHDPTRRLGYGPGDGSRDIMGHKFFTALDWDQMSKRRVEVPNEIRLYLKGEGMSKNNRGSQKELPIPEHEALLTSPATATTTTTTTNHHNNNNNGMMNGLNNNNNKKSPVNDTRSSNLSEDEPVQFFTGREDEEDLVQRMFPESELLARPERAGSKDRSSLNKSQRIKSLPILPRLSSLSGLPGLSSLTPLPTIELGPYLGYEFAVDDEALGEARRGSGLILSRWAATTVTTSSGT
jgi:serine/threonine protein kinase